MSVGVEVLGGVLPSLSSLLLRICDFGFWRQVSLEGITAQSLLGFPVSLFFLFPYGVSTGIRAYTSWHRRDFRASILRT